MKAIKFLHIACVLLCAVVVRLVFCWIYRDVAVPDVGVVNLMAKHVSEGGPWPVFYYGQAYMGSLEPLISAAFCRLLGVSGFAVCLGTAFVSLMLIPIMYRWGREAKGHAAGVFCAIFSIAVSYDFSVYMVSPRGGYAMTVVCIAATLWLTSRIVAREWLKEHVSWLNYAALGLAAGVGWWTNQAVTAALLVSAAVFFALMFLRRNVIGKSFLAAGFFFVGSAPWWLWNINHAWKTFAFSGSLGVLGWSDGAKLILFDHLPKLLGFGGDSAHAWWVRSLPGLSHPGIFTAIQVVAGTAYAGLFTLSCMDAARRRRDTAAACPVTLRISIAIALVYALVYFLLACTTKFNVSSTTRYMLPFVPALALLGGVGAAVLWSRRRVAACLVIVILLMFQAREMRDAWRKRVAYDGLRKLAVELASGLNTLGVDKLYGDFPMTWLNFAMREQVTLCGLPLECLSEYRQMLEMEDHPAFLGNSQCITNFIGRTGGSFASQLVTSMNIRYEIKPSGIGVAPVLPSDWKNVELDRQPVSPAGVLNDRDLSTYLAFNVTTSETHEIVITLRSPRLLARLQWYAPEYDRYPILWEVEGRESPDAPWQSLASFDFPGVFVWSGPRVYYDTDNYYARADFTPRLLGEIRIKYKGMYDSLIAASEVELFEQSPALPLETAQIDTLVDVLRSNDVKKLYCSRWVANQVAHKTKGGIWTPRDPVVWGIPRKKEVRILPENRLPVSLDPGSGVLVRQEDADATRALLANACVTLRETTLAPWVLFSIDSGKPATPNVFGLVWTGVSVMRDSTITPAGLRMLISSLPELRSSGLPEDRIESLLRAHLKKIPNHPQLLAELIKSLELQHNEQAKEMRSYLQQLKNPEVPLRVLYGTGIELFGYSGLSGVFHPGDSITYRLYWRHITSGQRPCVFVHVRDANKKTVFQDDRAVLEFIPADICQEINKEGYIYSQAGKLLVPDNIPPGKYEIYMGVWDPETKHRYSARGWLPLNWSSAVRLPSDLKIEPHVIELSSEQISPATK